MKILLCPNAFKGSLTAEQAAQAMAEGIAQARQETGVRLDIVRVPLADGGDGTLHTLVTATGGTLHDAVVSDPLGRPITAQWGRLGGIQSETAVIEMAAASGLRLLKPDEYDPLHTTTRGTGELMRTAIESGCTTLLVGIGGSATNDGGAGMAQALGFGLKTADGRDIQAGGGALSMLDHLVPSAFWNDHPVRVIVACDVDNPLCGAEGAAAVYGPQKGATPNMVTELDANLAHYAKILQAHFGRNVAEVAGAGAAGGLGAGLMAFCGATLRSGTEMVFDAVQFDTHLAGCALVLTGEGRLDGQTARGKVIAQVVRRAKGRNIPVVALAGTIEEGAENALRAEGLTAAFSILDRNQPIGEAMRDGYALLRSSAERLARLLACLARLT
jgi:glycerate 2-kinase